MTSEESARSWDYFCHQIFPLMMDEYRASGCKKFNVFDVDADGPAQPDFISAAPGRFEGNLISIGRELRTTFPPRGRYKLIGSTGRNQRVEIPPPDVLIPHALHIDQSVPSD